MFASTMVTKEMSADTKINEAAVDLLRRLRKNWDHIRNSNLSVLDAVSSITIDCLELFQNDRYRNILLGLHADHKDPPSIEQVLMDHFKTIPSNMVILDAENGLSSSFSSYLVTGMVGDESSHSKNKNWKRSSDTLFMSNIMADPSFKCILDRFPRLRTCRITSNFLIALFQQELNQIDSRHTITFLELQRRLACVERRMQSNPGERFSSKLAPEWEKYLDDESKKLHYSRAELLMKADAAWIPVFTELFSSEYIDELAGLCLSLIHI